MTPAEKKALDRYINATEKRVAQWMPAQREAFLKATQSASPAVPQSQDSAEE